MHKAINQKYSNSRSSPGVGKKYLAILGFDVSLSI
jgi:hypothetical protein